MGLRSLALVVLGFVVGGAVVLFADGGTDDAPAAASSPLAVPADAAADGHAHGHSGASTLTGDTPCEQAGLADPEAIGQGGDDHRGPSAWTALDRASRDVLEAQLNTAHQVALDYPTVADATAAGWRMVTAYVPCIGAHYLNTRYAIGGFDPATPAMLLYDGTAPESRIVGLSYAQVSGTAPEGFAGPNDEWHRHNRNGGLCLRAGVVVGGEATSAKECAALGGSKSAGNEFWMMHAWVADGWPSSWGVFSAEHPDLGGVTGDINAPPPSTPSK